jgi:hypothetical protein
MMKQPSAAVPSEPDAPFEAFARDAAGELTPCPHNSL